MGFFKNLVNTNLASDDLKREIAQSFYNNNKKLSDDDVRALHVKTGIALDPSHTEFLAKSFISTTIEEIFQSANKDKTLRSGEWKLARGFAKGAANLINDSRILEHKYLVLELALFILESEFNVPRQNAVLLIEQYYH